VAEARGGTLGSLEVGRFAAASWVALAHFLPNVEKHAAAGQRVFGGWRPPGALGVEYFFVLSGFVMMIAHGADRGNWRAVPIFWARRAARIYPIYWLALLVPLCYLYPTLTPGRFAELVALQPAGGVDFISQAWTLRYEIGFYFMFGLWLLPYIGRPLLALWIFGVCWAALHSLPLGWSHLPVPPFPRALSTPFIREFSDSFTFYFFTGMGAGWVVDRFRPELGLSGTLIVAGLAGLLLTLPAEAWGYGYGKLAYLRLLTGAGFAAMIAGVAGLERRGKLRFGSTARSLGKLSYPLYITHTPALLVFSMYTGWLKLGTAGLYGLVVVGLAALYALAALVTFGVDQPLQRRVRRWLAIRAPVPI